MSVCRKLPDGTIQKIAGHTVIADGSCAEVRKGTVEVNYPSTIGTFTIPVVFTDPMTDADYEVFVDNQSTGYNPWGGSSIHNKTKNGFSIVFYNSTVPSSSNKWSSHWAAIKLITMEGYTELKNKVDNPDTTPTENSTNLCTSGGIYEAIKNASAVWKGTKAEWNALPATDKMKYDLAVLIDTQLIKSVDRTDGTDTDVADLTGKIFRGTEAEWEALSAAEKDEYDQAEVCDVEDPVVVFDPSMPSVKAGAVNHTTTVASNNEVRFNVTFTTAMADSNYAVTLSSALLGTFWADQNLSVTNVTANGFVIIAFNSSSGSYTPDAGSKIYWNATPFIS